MEIRIELFDAKKCAPVESGEYFAITEGGCMNMAYSRKNGGWNLRDNSENRDNELFPLYWSDRIFTGKEIKDMSV